MSIPQEGLVNFQLTGENAYWQLLQDAQRFHVSARSKHGDLLDLCKSKGVKFSDIKNHLMNEAKKVGLYRRDYWSDKQRAMVFRTWSDLIECKYGWVIALHNFLNWVKANYVDYGVRKGRVARKNTPATVNKSTVVRRTTDAAGKVSETKTETIETVEPTAAPSGIVAPITQDLTVLQKQTLILQNLDILGNICKEKNCIKEFNLLMVALGSVEYVIEA